METIKLVFLVLSITFCLCTISCASQKSKNALEDTNMKQTETTTKEQESNNEAHETQVNTSNSITFVFSANATTGYSWTFEISNPEFLMCSKEQYIVDSHAPNMVGVGGKKYFTFKSQNTKKLNEAIHVSVTFEYSRPWEKREDNKKEIRNINIYPDGSIEEAK